MIEEYYITTAELYLVYVMLPHELRSALIVTSGGRSHITGIVW